MTTFLGAPVRARGKVFGNLYLTEKEGGQTFDAADQDAAVTLATQAGVAIANAQIYRELKQRERWLGALHEITAALLAGAPQPVVLTTIVRSARKMIGADLAAIALPVEVGSTALRIVAADGIGSDRLLSAPGRPSGTASHSVLSTGRPLLARLESVDFQSHLVSDAVPVGVLMVVPLLLRERVNGTIILTRSASDADFNSNDLSLLESFASQAALTLDYDRFQAQARALAVIEERHRIARDLHDEPVQALIYLAQRLEALAVESSTAATFPTKLKDTRELAVAVVDGLRQLTEGLRSEILDIDGLAAALKDLARRFTLRTDIPARFAIRGTPARWDPELERNLFRLAQEALSNIERHAEARKVRLDLFLRPGGLTLRVADDGVGFVTSGQGAISPGLGTIGMQERAALHGGRLLIRSRPGRGTVLLATVPVTQGPDGGGNHPWDQE
jgi:signal transduction histidine kinase